MQHARQERHHVLSYHHAPPRHTATPASQCYTRATNGTTPLPHTDNFTAPYHTTTRASDHITVTNLATTPLLPTKQLLATTFTPHHHTARTLLWVEDLMSGDNYLVNSGSEVGRLVEERVSYITPVIHIIMPQRLERYDFSFVYEYASIDFSMAKPVLRPQWQSLYYPLSSLVWASVLIILLLTPFILILDNPVSQFQNSSYAREEEKENCRWPKWSLVRCARGYFSSRQSEVSEVLAPQRLLKDNEIDFFGNDEWPSNAPDLSVCKDVGVRIELKIINIVEKGSKLGASITSHQAMTGMLLGQNLPRCLPNTNSVRVLVAAWLVGALVLMSAYRGNLTAHLTLPKYPPRPETIPQLVNTVDRITMQEYGAEFKNFFAKSESPLFRKLASLIYFVKSGKTGQEQALLKSYFLIYFNNGDVKRKLIFEISQAHLENRRYQLLRIAERFTRADGEALLYIGRDSVMPGQSAWPMPHDAPYKPVIDRCLMAVIEGGLYEKWNKDYLLLAQEKSPGLEQELEAVNIDNGNDGSFTPLTIVHLQGAFMALLIGFLMSSVLEVNEIVLKYLASQE
ncbi:hypothetical protein Pcinc_025822 [Petrolisthes cinctipes]|uniref:Ionotropic glutamate receptor C-terminal domain-containing protein n=1 Tax=Petrolisthes cinctipes TaxID=88211 RepID=A0AAE1F754_PETCI|nr:hypothetical protein Pcinc_025822 [Petrolisthes cinctipes]